MFLDIIFKGSNDIVFSRVLGNKLFFFHFVLGDDIFEFDNFFAFDDLVFDNGLLLFDKVVSQSFNFFVFLLLFL